MKNYFISTLTAIALAVPLGIGGLTLTAPVTATDAEANRIAHHFGTCSIHVITKCAPGYRDLIFKEFRDLFNHPGWYERGANGADLKTFGHLEWRVRTNQGYADRSREYLQRAFTDRDVPADFTPHRYRGLGYMHPDDRAIWDERARREAEQRRQQAEQDRLNAILNSRSEQRITQHFCDQVGGEFRDYIPQGSHRNVCVYFGNNNGTAEYLRHFVDPEAHNRSTQWTGRLRPHLREQYQIGVPFENLLRRFQNDCNYHNGEYKAAGGLDPANPASCAVQIGQEEDGSANFYRVTEFTGWHHATPNVYTRRLGNLRIPAGVSYADYEEDTSVGLQVTQISPVTLADLNSDADPVASTRGVVVEHRETIIDLVDNVNANENRLFALEPLVEANSLVIENLGDSLATLADEVASVQENVEENRAGVAVALAIPRSGLQNEERFRLSAAIGNFKGESALGVALEFRLSPPVSFSVGGGFSQQGSSGARAEISYGW